MSLKAGYSPWISRSELSIGVETKTTISSCSDEELMARYQSADEAAFAEIYARYARKIYGFLVRRLGNRDDCAELFQETFLRLHRARSSYKPKMSFKTWLYTIAQNLIRDRFRRKERSRITPLTALTENVIEKAAPDGSRLLLSFKEAFETLTDEQKEAIILSRFEGLRYNEIAVVMGRSSDAVNQLIQRAIRHLRESMDGA